MRSTRRNRACRRADPPVVSREPGRKDGVRWRSTVVVQVYSTHMTCLFPQHGPGKKHERPIRLEAWQSNLVAVAPWRFLRGCIWSDGCAFINRTGPYEYLSYGFANLSQDILDLVDWARGLVGVDCRRTSKSIPVYRRASVALVHEHVGLTT